MDNGACAGDVGKFESAVYDAGRHMVLDHETRDTMQSIVQEQMAKLNFAEVKPFLAKVNECSLSKHGEGYIKFDEVKAVNADAKAGSGK